MYVDYTYITGTYYWKVTANYMTFMHVCTIYHTSQIVCERKLSRYVDCHCSQGSIHECSDSVMYYFFLKRNNTRKCS